MPALLGVTQAVDGGLAAVGAAVVDHPENPAGRGVGLVGHDLVDQAHERVDAAGALAAAEDLGAVHVPGGQVAQGSAAVVLVLHAHRPAGGAVSKALLGKQLSDP